MTKRLIVMVVLAVVLAALTVPVNADEFARAYQNTLDTVTAPIRMMGQNLCDNHRGTGDAMEASWCYGQVRGYDGRYEGFNPNSVRGQRMRGFRADDVRRSRYDRDRRYPSYGYGGYDGYSDYGYGGYGVDVDLNGRNVGAVIGGVAGGIATRNSRSGWVRAGGIIGGAVLGGVVGNQIDRRNERREYRGEDSSECVKNTLKEFSKRHVAVSAAQVIAMCGGGSEASARNEQIEPEAPESYAPESNPVQSVQQVAPSVYIKGDSFCNATSTDVVVLVDDFPVGVVKAGQVTSVAQARSLERQMNPGGSHRGFVTYADAK